MNDHVTTDIGQLPLHEYDLGAGVKVFSTMRHPGGFSKGNYSCFNINRYCGDNEQDIFLNRQLLCTTLGIPSHRLIMPHQTHGTVTRMVSAALPASSDDSYLEGVDAVMTNEEMLCIGVSTADCIPIIIYDPVRRVACAIHAGWRGTCARIACKSIEAMMTTYGCHCADMRCIIGPGISAAAFEVGDEVYDAFIQAQFDMDDIAFHTNKWHIDLKVCNKLQMMQMGIKEETIFDCGICTFSNNQRWFSARRQGISSGRIYTGIMMTKE